MKITKAGPEDLEEVREIGVRSYSPHYDHLWKPGGMERYHELCFGDEALRRDLNDPNVEYYIISDAGENVGFLKLILRKPLPASNVENALYLEKIYFVKEWTGKGAGRKLIELTFDRARELQRECVWLMAMDTSDKPIKAYERAGFVVHSRERHASEWIKPEYRGMIVLKKCFGETADSTSRDGE